VGFPLDAEVKARLGERGIDPRGPAVHDDQSGTVPEEEPVDPLIGEVRGVPVSIAGHEYGNPAGRLLKPRGRSAGISDRVE
jgi:hypothetical protein